jgi:serine beta-lactamase-like protein LACTB
VNESFPSLRFEEAVINEMREWGIGGVAVTLLKDQDILYSAAFGEAARDSIFRVGSISKLFNAVAVMQLVEAGKLRLDDPVAPDLLPINPFPDSPPVTLRQLLCHRSGLQRESPVGGYFDDSQPSLAATVASVRSCVLATGPGAKTRYSNIGPSIAGHIIERTTGMTFAEYQRNHLLGPLSMADSSWSLASVRTDRLIGSWMRIADGKGCWIRREAPVFDLGTVPAGNLFSTADDLARFASALMVGDSGLLKPETLQGMWRPQLTDEDSGYGLGFMVGKYRGCRMVSHGGAVYGHSALFALLPDQKFAVIVLANEDIVNGRMRAIADTALSLLLEPASEDKSPRRPELSSPRDLSPFAGQYESDSYWACIETCNGKLTGDISGQPTRFVARGGLEFTAESRIENAATVLFEREPSGTISGFKMGSQYFRRVLPTPRSLPPEWQVFLGEYGPDFIPVIVSERHGHLYAMTENMVDYRLTPINRHVCALPAGMYTDEQIVFLTDGEGRPHSVNFANMILPRRNIK